MSATTSRPENPNDASAVSTAPDLASRVAARARETELLRQLHPDTLDDFVAQGLLRWLQPQRYGGAEVTATEFFEAVTSVSSGCASSGWVLSILGTHALQMALFPEQAQQEVWSQPEALICSSYAPTGSVQRVPGGFILRGRWSYSSGCDFCSWVFLGGVIAADDKNLAESRTFLLPRSDYQIVDTWHVAGLCGSGSRDIVVEEAFVPEHRTHRFLDAFLGSNPGAKACPGPLYRMPFGSVFATAVAVPAIGAAEGALAEFVRLTRGRMSAYDQRAVSDEGWLQSKLAAATAALASARSSIMANVAEMEVAARAGEVIPVERRARFRWDAANGVQSAAQAVTWLFEASGGRAIFLDHPIQRAWRDVHAIRAHAMNNPDKAARLFARACLGDLMKKMTVTDLFL